MPFRRLIRFAGAAGIVLIAVLSVVPGGMRPDTGLSGAVDHFLAYALTALTLSFGWPAQALSLVLGLWSFGGLCEAAQIWVPGRRAELVTVFINGAGATVGAALARALQRR